MSNDSTSIRSNVINLFIGKALRAPIWLLISAALARVLGPEDLGAWSMILAAGMLFNQFFLHWTQAITLRFGRIEFSESSGISKTMSSRLVLLSVSLLLGAVLLYFYSNQFFEITGVKPGLNLCLAALTFWTMSESQSLQQIREKFARMAWSPIVADLLLLVTIVVIGLLAFDNAKDFSKTGIQTFLFVMALTWVVILTSELKLSDLKIKKTENDKLKCMIFFAIPLVPGYMVAYLSEWLDYYLIKNSLGSFWVGIYHPAYQYLLITIGLPTALASVLLPKYVDAFEKSPDTSVKKLTDKDGPLLCLLWLMLIILPVAVMPGVLDLLVGADFEESSAILSLLLIAAPGAAVQHVFGISYFLCNRLGLSTFLFFLIKLIVNAMLSIVLLPSMGVAGSATGAVVSFLVLQWLFVLFSVQKKLPSAGGVACLLWCQICGVLIATSDDTMTRLLIACSLMLATFIYIRWSRMFDENTIKWLIPNWLKKYEPNLLYLLSRKKG